ncbi:hypothetical protein [Nocardioides sp. Root140]|nr:hypothetical protein [Nocardioides sp. Root140]
MRSMASARAMPGASRATNSSTQCWRRSLSSNDEFALMVVGEFDQR